MKENEEKILSVEDYDPGIQSLKGWYMSITPCKSFIFVGTQNRNREVNFDYIFLFKIKENGEIRKVDSFMFHVKNKTDNLCLGILDLPDYWIITTASLNLEVFDKDGLEIWMNAYNKKTGKMEMIESKHPKLKGITLSLDARGNSLVSYLTDFSRVTIIKTCK
jgi:hypothetical protein